MLYPHCTIKVDYDSRNCSNLKEILEQKIDFSGYAKSVWFILTDMSYKYKKAMMGKKKLCWEVYI